MPSNVFLESEPEKTYPLIELLGDLDVGKVLIAEAVARKLKGVCLKFPHFNVPHSLTGMGLLTMLSKKPRDLEDNPHWWCCMYLANLWENQNLVLSHLEYCPVVVVNWATAAKMYYRMVVEDEIRTSWSPLRSLREPEFKFMLSGEPHIFPGNLTVDFSPKFKRDLRNTVRSTFLHCQKIRVEFETGDCTREVNKIAENIVRSILRKRPDLKVQDFQYKRKTLKKAELNEQ